MGGAGPPGWQAGHWVVLPLREGSQVIPLIYPIDRLLWPQLEALRFFLVTFLILLCSPAVLTALQWLSSGWKCARCDLRENLWLNLTDGSVLCGKWFFDSSGGNGHALEHYRDMGYPLAVKLGTITPDGAGECACTDSATWRGLPPTFKPCLNPRAGGCRLWILTSQVWILIVPVISCKVLGEFSDPSKGWVPHLEANHGLWAQCTQKGLNTS